jgi:hypothetical protein
MVAARVPSLVMTVTVDPGLVLDPAPGEELTTRPAGRADAVVPPNWKEKPDDWSTD